VHALTNVKEAMELNFNYEISVTDQLRLPAFLHISFGMYVVDETKYMETIEDPRTLIPTLSKNKRKPSPQSIVDHFDEELIEEWRLKTRRVRIVLHVSRRPRTAIWVPGKTG